MLDKNEVADGPSELRKFQKAVELLTRENEALRSVLARLHQENVRLAETLLKATSDARRQTKPNDNPRTERSP